MVTVMVCLGFCKGLSKVESPKLGFDRVHGDSWQTGRQRIPDGAINPKERASKDCKLRLGMLKKGTFVENPALSIQFGAAHQNLCYQDVERNIEI